MKPIVFLLLLLSTACKNDTLKTDAAEAEQDIKTSPVKLDIHNYDSLEPLIHRADDKIHVVNFWATWCAPCVKELPYFEYINETYKDKNVEVLLISLDFPKNYDSKLIPFIEKHHLKSQVVAFDDTDQNRWIPAIDESWTGAIPATLIYKGDKRQFYERSFTQEELEIELKQFLK